MSKLHIETLEDRITPSSYWWLGNNSQDMSDCSNYRNSSNNVPSQTDWNNDNSKNLYFEDFATEIGGGSIIMDPHLSTTFSVRSINCSSYFSDHTITIESSGELYITNGQLTDGNVDVDGTMEVDYSSFNWNGGNITGAGNLHFYGGAFFNVSENAHELGVQTYVGQNIGGDVDNSSTTMMTLSSMNNNLILSNNIIVASPDVHTAYLRFGDYTDTGSGIKNGIETDGQSIIENYGYVYFSGVAGTGKYLYIDAEIDNYYVAQQWTYEKLVFYGSCYGDYDFYNEGVFNTYDDSLSSTTLEFFSGFYQTGSNSSFNMKTKEIFVSGNMNFLGGYLNGGFVSTGSVLEMYGSGMGDGDINLTDTIVDLRVRNVSGTWYQDEIYLGYNSLILNGTQNILALTSDSSNRVAGQSFTLIDYTSGSCSGSWDSTDLKDWTFHAGTDKMYID